MAEIETHGSLFKKLYEQNKQNRYHPPVLPRHPTEWRQSRKQAKPISPRKKGNTSKNSPSAVKHHRRIKQKKALLSEEASRVRQK
ncbi:hypothetical protein D187_002121 [Cystobacter fuscus DSM 2262]|uniref:Uncharacterized protein n=1 Tax=Cystobacter fuscus (strain ATCC 25194 / DSM 2262 / NBRC 100088 / M29) TaxID=1242864 RepID=S9P6G2_CYSF2|nr:hypothetical protein D187_002121 [Cystobacter fuscus DSM 2262]